MLKDNFSISQTRKTLKKTNPVSTVVILFLLMQVPGIIFAPLYTYIYFKKNNISYSSAKDLVAAMSGDGMLFLNLYLTAFVVVIGFLFAKHYQKRNKESLGLTNPNKVKNYIKGLGLGILMIFAVVFTLKIVGVADIKINIESISWPVFILFILGWMIQGFEEEFITRAILMNYFAANNGIIRGIIINSLIFSLLHLGNPGFAILPFINILLIGIVFSLLFYLSDDLFLPAAVHSIWNFAQGNLFGISVSGLKESTNTIFRTSLSGSPILTGGIFGVEGSIVVTLVEVIVLCLLIKTIKDRNLYSPTNK